MNAFGGRTSTRTRDTEVGSLLSIDGDDLYGAFPDPPPPGRWVSLNSASSIGRDAGHRMGAIQLDGAFSDISYSCDGQVTSALDLDFDYDELGRLRGVDHADGTAFERYYYDGLGRLAAYEDLTSGEGKQRFVYQGDHMLAAYNPYHHDGSTWTGTRWEAVWGPGQDQLLAFVDEDHTGDAPRVLHVMRDHRNSVVGADDAETDTVVGRAHYNAEGRLMTFDTNPNTRDTSDITHLDCQEIGSHETGAPPFVCKAPGGMPFAFNGMWRSPVTGLVYMRNRVYSPRLGEFLSHDPLGYVDSTNLYQFASFDPINHWDPEGQNVIAWAVGIGIGVAAVAYESASVPTCHDPGGPRCDSGMATAISSPLEDLNPKAAVELGSVILVGAAKGAFKKAGIEVSQEALTKIATDFGENAGELFKKEVYELENILKKAEKELAEAVSEEGSEHAAKEGAEELTKKVISDGGDAGAKSVDEKIASGKKAKDSSKNEKHGDGGREIKKAQERLVELDEQIKNATGNELKRLRKKRQRILENARSAGKGEEHGRVKKR